MKTSSAKAKGRRLCALVRDLLLKAFPKLEEGDILVTSSSVTGVDLIFSPFAKQTLPFAVECKNQEKLNIWSSLAQAKSHSTVDTPLLVFSRNRDDIYCALKFSDLLEILKSCHNIDHDPNQLEPGGEGIT